MEPPMSEAPILLARGCEVSRGWRGRSVVWGGRMRTIRLRGGSVGLRSEAARSWEACTMTSPIVSRPSPSVGTGDVLVADALEASYAAVRRQTEALCTPLATEDYVIQSMPEA